MTQNIITYDKSIDDRLKTRFEELLSLLTERNSKVNLTAIREPDEIREKHFADSLAVMLWEKWTNYTEGARILDLGTGGGFPGLPIKLANPEANVTMLDSVRKKLEFVDDVIDEMNLTDTCTLWSRAEDAARSDEHRAGYDLVVSRAMAYLPTLLEYAVPFLKEGGYFIAYKRGDCDQEIREAKRALSELRAEITEIIPYQICDHAETAGSDDYSKDSEKNARKNTEKSSYICAVTKREESGKETMRKLLVIRKCGPTPGRYPRRAGKPAGNPIQ